MDVGAWEKMVALLSAIVDSIVSVFKDGLKDGELAVVSMGEVEMTDAVFVAPAVVPFGEMDRKYKI